MFAYSTISPYYFDYLASAMTRQEILDDPELCHLLENPYTKDNMEMALHFKDAKRGGYDEKKKFLEYFFANGPELEPDTILYYREKCMVEPAYMQIAEIVISDIEYIDNIRKNRYGKSVSEDNCFTNPCNYLAPLSSSIGMMGDSNNFLTLSNIFAKFCRQKEEEKKDNKEESKPTDNKSETDDKKVGEGTKDEDGCDNVWGHIRQHVTNKIIPNIRIGCQAFYDNMKNDMKAFAERCVDVGLGKHISLGDPRAIDRAELLSAATKANVLNKMGDCGRLWQYMRQYNPYDSYKNTKGPMSDEKIVANKSTAGTSIDNTPATSVKKTLPPSVVSAAAAKGDKTAEAIKKLQELKFSITEADIANLRKPDSEFSRDQKLELIAKIQGSANSARAAYRAAENKIMDEYGIGDIGDDYARFSEARDIKDAENEKLSDEFYELVNIIREQDSGQDENTRANRTEEESENEVDYSLTGAPADAEDDEDIDPAAKMAREGNEASGVYGGLYNL